MYSRTSFGRLVALAALAAVSGCGGAEKRTAVEVPPGGILLKGAGATFPSLLFKEWFAAYQKDHPTTAIAYAPVGSGEGIRRFTGKDVEEGDRVDFGASDAAMTDEQIARVPQGVLMLPVTAGSVVLGYNLPDLEVPLRLSRKAYAGIFLGTVKTWNDPLIAESNPGAKLPRLTIVTVVRQDSSGTTYAFTKHLDAISEAWRSQHGAATVVDWPGNAMRAAGNEGVAGRILHSVGSIGYLNYGSARQIGLRMAVVENKEGLFVEPTAENCASSLASAELPENLRLFVPDPSGPNSYPIVTLSWVLLYRAHQEQDKATAIHDLFRWALASGQGYGADKGYIPLPAVVGAKALAALDALASGGT